MHGVVTIVNVALLCLHGVITLSEMLLWGAAPAPYHLAAEGKALLIPPPLISFPGSCAQAQQCFARLTDRPDFQFVVDCSMSRSPGAGCQGLLSILLCLRLSDASVSFRLGIQPCLCAPPALNWRDFCPKKRKSPPS